MTIYVSHESIIPCPVYCEFCVVTVCTLDSVGRPADTCTCRYNVLRWILCTHYKMQIRKYAHEQLVYKSFSSKVMVVGIKEWQYACTQIPESGQRCMESCNCVYIFSCPSRAPLDIQEHHFTSIMWQINYILRCTASHETETAKPEVCGAIFYPDFKEHEESL